MAAPQRSLTVQPLTWSRLTVAAGSVGVVVWAVSAAGIAAGSTPVPLPWSLAVVLVVMGIVALIAARPVRLLRDGKRRGVNALRAARTAVLAQAVAFTGAIFAGGAAGYVVALLPHWSHSPRRSVAVDALVVVVAGCLAILGGVVAERWCRVSDDDASGSADAA